MHQIARAVVATSILIALTACTSSPPAPSSPTSTTASSEGSSTQARSPGSASSQAPLCSQIIDHLDDLPDGYIVHSGILALPATITLVGRGEGSVRFAKAGLAVRRDTAVEIESPDPAVSVEYGNPTPTQKAMLPACPSDKTWVIYPGGFWSTAPGCYEFTVTSKPATFALYVGLSVACA